MAELPRPRASDQRSGCLTVLYVVLGLFALMGVTFGVGTCMFMRSETGQKVIKTAREGISVMREATTAPGTQELRDRGCEIAMVMAFTRLFEVLKEISPEAAQEASKQQMPGNGTVVMCQIRTGATDAPDCPDVARTYGAAVPKPPVSFGVMVQETGGSKARCEGTYAPDGTYIAPFEPAMQPPTPTPGPAPTPTPTPAPDGAPVEAP